MLSCTEFIPAYSHLFRFLEEREGHEGVVKYWEFISDNYVVQSLGKEVEEKGIRGCYEYWSHTLNEEAADFTMTLDEQAGEFTIDMHYCPSKGRLLNFEQIEPYYDYCGHCDLLYRRVLEKHGFHYEYDCSACDKAACKLTVRT
ncbi:hypothetical protein LJC27_06295 [Christensenellaceae bacterium OttesenSCG-928-M15]|nr:hypothetical protein [Christensenellaceae bacterium OttesenSCG-928-M15]